MSFDVAHPLEVWLLIAVNFLGFILGTFITSVSYYAYRSSDGNTSLRNATVGSGLLTVGMAIDPTYQLGVHGSRVLTNEEHITLQVIEGIVIAPGFFILFSSIYKYSSDSTRYKLTLDGIDSDLSEEFR